MIHAQGAPRCAVVCECTTCWHDQHLDHSCFVRKGIPTGLKLEPKLAVEITRLNGLYMAGQFDKFTPPSCLRWLP